MCLDLNVDNFICIHLFVIYSYWQYLSSNVLFSWMFFKAVKLMPHSNHELLTAVYYSFFYLPNIKNKWCKFCLIEDYPMSNFGTKKVWSPCSILSNFKTNWPKWLVIVWTHPFYYQKIVKQIFKFNMILLNGRKIHEGHSNSYIDY